MGKFSRMDVLRIEDFGPDHTVKPLCKRGFVERMESLGGRI